MNVIPDWEKRGWHPTENPQLFWHGWRVWWKEQGQVVGCYGYLITPDAKEMTLLTKEQERDIHLTKK
jgi:hypothetical protein